MGVTEIVISADQGWHVLRYAGGRVERVPIVAWRITGSSGSRSQLIPRSTSCVQMAASRVALVNFAARTCGWRSSTGRRTRAAGRTRPPLLPSPRPPV
jgi:hypothetical protein